MAVNAIEQNLNKLFVKEMYGQTTEAILREIRKKKVVLQCPKREDSYTIPVAEFNKKYRLAAMAP